MGGRALRDLSEKNRDDARESIEHPSRGSLHPNLPRV